MPSLNLKKPHDSFFKELMSNPDVVKHFLTCFLPKNLQKHLNLHTLQIISPEKIDRKYKRYYLDLVASCKLLNKQCEIYLVFEHKSYPDKLTLIQILSYFSAVWEEDIKNGKTPRPIIPIVFYHGKERFNLPKRFSEYFEVPETIKKYLLDFEVIVFDTNEHSDEKIMQCSGNLYLVAGLLAMKHIFKDLKEMKKIFEVVFELEKDKQYAVFNYIVMAKDIKEEDLIEVLKEGGEIMPSLAERWLKQGFEQGLEAGIQQGIQQGLILEAQDMVLSAIEVKLGYVPKNIEKKVKNIFDREKLKIIHKEIIKTSNLLEVLKKHLG